MDYKFRFPPVGRTLKQDLLASSGRPLGLGLWMCVAAVGAFSACSGEGSSFDGAAGAGGAPVANGGSSSGGSSQFNGGSTSMGGAIGNGGSVSPQGGSIGSAGASGAPSAGHSSGGSAQGGSVNPGTGGAPAAGTGAGGAPAAGTGAGGAPTAGTGAGGAPTAGTGAGGAPTAGTGAGGAPTAGTGGGSVGPACPKPAPAICHEFFAADNSRRVLNYVNEFEPLKKWTVPVSGNNVNSPRQIELVDSSKGSGGKAVMVSVDQGYEEYDMVSGARLVSVLGQSGVRGAVRLAGGNTVLAVGDDTMRVVNASGTQISSCTLPGGTAGDSLRVINRDPTTGFFLLGRLQNLYIVNANCQQQWTAALPAGGKAYSVFPRAGGGVWATSGSPSTVIEYSQAGMILRQLGGKTAHPGLGLDFFSGFELLPNGNVLAANWQGHVGSPARDTPHLVEFDQTNKLVWRWGDQDLARQITNTLVIR